MGLLNKLNTDQLVRNTIEQIKEVYLKNKLPFVIGYSGGKDSTLTTQLVFQALGELPVEELKYDVYVISSDTLVETPPVVNQILNNHKSIEFMAKKKNIPIKTVLVRPLGSQTFWSNLIGRGYPSPNQTFRWCTDRLKIDPANRFIKDTVSEHGEVIMVLGVREGESISRDRVMESHSVEGKILMRHSTLNNAYVFAPIKNFSVDDVWDYLLNNPSPWGADNQELYKLYANSNSGECPLVIDQETKNRAGSCGNSRLGCWTCTVVDQDKALSGFIENGEEWLRPLLQYRNWLASFRDDRSMRMKKRTGGAVYFSPIVSNNDDFIIPKKTRREKLEIKRINSSIGIDSNGETWKIFESEKEARKYIKSADIDLSSEIDPKIIAKMRTGSFGQLGLGPYTMEARKEILEKLLSCQKNLDKEVVLISDDELFEIRKLWIEQGDLEDQLPEVYSSVYGENLHFNQDDQPTILDEDLEILKILCKKHNIDYKMYKRLINVEKNNLGNLMRRKAVNEFTNIIRQDYLHIGEDYEN